MSRYNRCKECYNMDCIFVTGEREDIDTSKCADFRSMTNADRIRSMTDEELAEWLAKQEYKKPTFDGWLPLCNKVMGPRICHEDGCEKCWLDWLKSPAEVDDG